MMDVQGLMFTGQYETWEALSYPQRMLLSSI